MPLPRFRIRTLMFAVVAAAMVIWLVRMNDDVSLFLAQGVATLFVTVILADVLLQPGERLRWAKRRRLCRR